MLAGARHATISLLTCAFLPPHLTPVPPEMMPETTTFALSLWCRVAGFGGRIFGLLWTIRLPTVLGVPMMLLSPKWPAGPVPRLCRTGCHQHTCSLAQQPGHGLREVPQGTLLLALGICGCQQPDKVAQSWLAHGPAHTWQSGAGGEGQASPEQVCPLLTVPLAAVPSA